jgi:hypothetical protein
MPHPRRGLKPHTVGRPESRGARPGLGSVGPTHPRCGLDPIARAPERRKLQGGDYNAGLYPASGSSGWGYAPPPSFQILWNVSLDPDNTSVWISSVFPSPVVIRLDLNSGQLLSDWTTDGGPIAVYGPPLLGDANVENTVDSNTAGTAEAFVTPAGYSGQMSRLHLYVDSSSTASQVVVGIYANRNGHPGILQKQAAITNLRAGTWNYIDVPSPSMPVTAWQRYWIAVLGPSGSGSIRFRDTVRGPGSETSSQHNLTALPATWSTGKTWATGNPSAYGS